MGRWDWVLPQVSRANKTVVLMFSLNISRDLSDPQNPENGTCPEPRWATTGLTAALLGPKFPF